MSTSKVNYALFAFASLFSMPSFSSGQNIYALSTLIKDGITSSSYVASAKWGSEAKREDINIAKSSLYPTLDMTSEVARAYEKGSTRTTEDNVKNQIMLNYRILDFGVRDQLIDESNNEWNSANYIYLDRESEIAGKVTKSFLTVNKQKELLDIIKNELSYYHDRLHDFEYLVKSGESTESDLKKIQASIDSLNVQKINVNEKLDDELNTLNIYTNDRISRNNLTSVPSAISKYRFNMDGEAFLSLILKQNSKVLSADKKIDAAKAEYIASKDKFFPTVDFQAGYTDNTPSNDSDIDDYKDEFRVGVKVGWNIFNGFKDVSDANKRRDMLNKTLADRDDLLKEVTLKIKSNAAQYRSGIESLKLANQSCRNARDLTSLYEQEFKIGQKSLLDLVTSRSELFRACSEIIESQYQVYTANLDQMLLGDMLIKTINENENVYR
ncbi:TPA: TolC family protein [Salmonella enterica subsp. diarizonae serovar 50:k:z35]